MTAEISEAPVIEKRGRGRPKGSKTKGRLLASPISKARPLRRPKHYNRTEAAEYLGISYDLLLELAAKHEVYRPAFQEGRTIIYLDVQLDEIISLVMRKRLTEEEGVKAWKQLEALELERLERHLRGETA